MGNENTSDELLQLAENLDIDATLESSSEEEKREMLKKTKIVKQTWSIQEIYQKIKSGKLNLSPEYQRNEIWKNDKQTAFLESLLMGIIVPPIYVVEIPGDDILDDSKYEVVDGKQRLTAIEKFLKNDLVLTQKLLEYYGDLFGGKRFSEIREIDPEHTSELLSSVLDIYVITANSPEFTKYDIFARLNKGAEKLKVNEIRKAIYRSNILNKIDEFINMQIDGDDDEKKENYFKIFTSTAQKRYDDYGRFYRSIAFYINSKYECNDDNIEVEDYKSRPREMINTILQKIQNKSIKIDNELQNILESTLNLYLKIITLNSQINNVDHLIDGCIPFIKDYKNALYDKLEIIINNPQVLSTLKKSPSTTTNVNNRLKYIKRIVINE